MIFIGRRETLRRGERGSEERKSEGAKERGIWIAVVFIFFYCELNDHLSGCNPMLTSIEMMWSYLSYKTE